MWGTVGAIVVRTSMTLVVVWLLKIPGLLFAGGLLLVWIAYKLLRAEAGDGHGRSSRRTASGGRCRPSSSPTPSWASTTCWRWPAPRTAASCWSSLGLLISIPIVIWGIDADPEAASSASPPSSTSAPACSRGPPPR